MASNKYRNNVSSRENMRRTNARRAKAFVSTVIVASSIGAIGVVSRNHEIEDSLAPQEQVVKLEDGIIDRYEMYLPNQNVLINIGDHDHVKTSFQSKKIQGLKNIGNNFGYILESEADTESEMYADIEYVKKLVWDYAPTYPVYLDINNIITNQKLNVENKTKIIKNFLDKCSANGIRAGLTGTDTNLCLMKEWCQIEGNYEVYVIMDKDATSIKYDGDYSLYKDADGITKAKNDVSKIIKENKLNTADKLVPDSSYTFKEGDDINIVAMRAGMSAWDLLKYNDILERRLEAGTILSIPSRVNTIIPTEAEIKEHKPISGDRYVGIDVSYCQSKIDWSKLKENIDFIILRANQGTMKDAKFDEFISESNINNIPVGIYCFNNYTSDSCSEMDLFISAQKEQAQTTIDLLANKKITFPAYLDVEPTRSGVDIQDQLEPEKIKVMLDIWYETMNINGYKPGIYSTKHGLEYMQSCVDYNLTDKFEIWRAGGPEYGHEIDVVDVPQIARSTDFSGPETVIQVTDSGQNIGASNMDGNVDLNIATTNYSPEEPVIIQNISDNNTDEIYGTVGSVVNLDAESGMRKFREAARNVGTVMAALGMASTPFVLSRAQKSGVKKGTHQSKGGAHAAK